MKTIALIPSRLKSTRLPGKALIDIAGLPMVVHVFKRTQLCKLLDEVYVATDSEEIYDTVVKHGGRAIMTSTNHKCGTDRIAEAAGSLSADIIINVQGDEPLLNPDDIDKLIQAVKADPSIDSATLVCKTPALNDTSECKVVMDLNGDIMYMSRSDIPSPTRVSIESLYKLYCIIAFRRDFLFKFASWDPTPMEEIEFIEYLRILEHGCKMRGVRIEEYTTSVDTPADLAVIEKMMAEDKIKLQYM